MRVGRIGLIATALCAVALTGWAGKADAQMPPAGATIGNQASATYTDGSGVSRTVSSNVVTTIVQQVAALTLTMDNTKVAVAGGKVWYPHTLTNTGNGTDTFSLLLTQLATDNFDLAGALIYPDADGDGVPDSGAAAITSTGPLVAGGSFRFVIEGSIPGSATNGQNSVVTIKGTSAFAAGVTALNTDTVSVTQNAVITATKGIDVQTGAAPSGPYTYTVTYTNNGIGAASNLKVEDIVPAGMTYVPGSARWSRSGGTALTDATGGDPSGIAYDFGQTTGNALTAVIASVPQGARETLTFQVMVASGTLAGTITNTATLSYNDGTGTTVAGSTNGAPFTVAKAAGVTITGDTVASAAQGGTVTFNNVVTNTGNATDIIDILLQNSTFPAGTTFQLYKSDGVTPLTASEGSQYPDTGPLAPGQSYTVVLKATLPPGFSGNGPYTVQKKAMSDNDGTVFAVATDSLGAVLANAVDLTNDAPYSATVPAPGQGQGPETNPVTTLTTNPGSTVRFTLYVNNRSSVTDSFSLQASLDKTFANMTLPPGMTVSFKDSGGAVITTTGAIAAGGSKVVYADMFVPSTTPPGTVSGYFRAISPTSGAFDIKHDAITVQTLRSISIQPDGNGQVQPGGSVVYAHTVTNTGNVLEGSGSATSSTTSTLVDSQPGWSSAVYYDANGNGVLDITDPIITDLSPMGGIAPGASKTIFVKVYSPAGAPVGAIDTTTVTLTTDQGIYQVAAPPAVNSHDTTTVISGQLQIIKEQALDANGDGTAETAFGTTNLTTGAVPGACIRYRIRLTNNGTTPATTVVLSDATPRWTTYHLGDGSTSPTGKACMSTDNNTTFVAITAPAADGTGTFSASVATIAPGQTVYVYFGVKIKQ
ncbi:MAG: hypothetical protein NT029_03170 [Armatimonadetes bacterium]|nr:hypothetical protein [Armatimonadota bacterium]